MDNALAQKQKIIYPQITTLNKLEDIDYAILKIST